MELNLNSTILQPQFSPLFIFFTIMNTSKPQVQQQYQNLRSKIQSQIQLLQKKLSRTSEIHYHRSINESKTIEPSTELEYHNRKSKKSCHHHHHSHSHLTAHSCCCSSISVNSGHCCKKSRKESIQSQNQQLSCSNREQQKGSINMIPLTLKNRRKPQKSEIIQDQRLSKSNLYPQSQSLNKKLIQHNLFLQEAFIKSIQNQQQMSNNIRLLQQKLRRLEYHNRETSSNHESGNTYQYRVLTEMNGQHNNSSTNRVRSEKCVGMSRASSGNRVEFVLKENSMRDKGQSVRDSKGQSSNRSKYREKRTSKSQSNKSLISKHKQFKSPIDKNRIKQSTASQQYLLNHKNPPNIPHLTNTKTNKLHNIPLQQYYPSHNHPRLCPVHFRPQSFKLKSQQKQIYKDSNHRNRKHQRNHLIQSFRQQELQRKKLIDKIVKK